MEARSETIRERDLPFLAHACQENIPKSQQTMSFSSRSTRRSISLMCVSIQLIRTGPERRVIECGLLPDARAPTNAVTLTRISSKLTFDDIAVQNEKQAERAVSHHLASDWCFRVGALPLVKNFPSGAWAILHSPHTHHEICGKIEGRV